MSATVKICKKKLKIKSYLSIHHLVNNMRSNLMSIDKTGETSNDYNFKLTSLTDQDFDLQYNSKFSSKLLNYYVQYSFIIYRLAKRSTKRTK